MNGRPFTPDERAAAQREATALYRQGHTIRCVSGVIGRPWSTVRSLLKDRSGRAATFPAAPPTTNSSPAETNSAGPPTPRRPR